MVNQSHNQQTFTFLNQEPAVHHVIFGLAVTTTPNGNPLFSAVVFLQEPDHAWINWAVGDTVHKFLTTINQPGPTKHFLLLVGIKRQLGCVQGDAWFLFDNDRPKKHECICFVQIFPLYKMFFVFVDCTCDAIVWLFLSKHTDSFINISSWSTEINDIGIIITAVCCAYSWL